MLIFQRDNFGAGKSIGLMVFKALPDQELAKALKQGNHQAFKEIFMRYWDVLLDSAYKRLGAMEEAEEIVQELFVTLYCNLPRKQLRILM